MHRIPDGPRRAKRPASARRSPAPPRWIDTPLGRVIRARELLHAILQEPIEPWKLEGWFWTWKLCAEDIAEARRADQAEFRDVGTGLPVEQVELAQVAERLRGMVERPDLRARVVDLGQYRRWRMLAA